jgi:hypothetical protein
MVPKFLSAPRSKKYYLVCNAVGSPIVVRGADFGTTGLPIAHIGLTSCLHLIQQVIEYYRPDY